MAGQGAGRQSKYQQIAAELREAIRDGTYGPGARLPGENTLMADHGVARMTARQALGVLQAEGLAEPRKGSGVFVREFRPLRRHGIERLAESNWGAGRSVWSTDIGDRQLVVDQVTVTRSAAPERIAAVLGTEPGAEACVRSRRFVLDGKPILVAVSYLPADVVAGSAITEPDSGPGGVYARLAELGRKPVRFREEIRSRMPSGDEAERLSLMVGVPVILICRTAFSADGRAVEVNEMTLDSSAYVLEYGFDA
jgi:GntR family transcriptional regulator